MQALHQALAQDQQGVMCGEVLTGFNLFQLVSTLN